MTYLVRDKKNQIIVMFGTDNGKDLFQAMKNDDLVYKILWNKLLELPSAEIKLCGDCSDGYH